MPGRTLKATGLAALVLMCGCASPAAPRAATVPRATPSPASIPAQSTGLMASRSATLSAARADVGRRPAAIRVPGYPGFSRVQAFTTAQGSRGLDLPKDASTVAWWSPGSMPGDASGTVVLAAHVSYNGRRGPFTHIDRLRTGMVVSIRQADGVVRNFRVAGERRVVKSALNSENLFRTTGPLRLALVTCGGTYDRATRSYSDNVIVYAVPTG